MREIKFKAKGISKDKKGKWVFGKYFVNQGLHYIIEQDDLCWQIDPNTLCQLITKINDIEIYEYDCYVDNNGIVYYLKYHNLGILTICVNYSKDEIEFEEWSSADIIKVERIIKHKFIGNLKDGEQYLLNKLREVSQ